MTVEVTRGTATAAAAEAQDVRAALSPPRARWRVAYPLGLAVLDFASFLVVALLAIQKAGGDGYTVQMALADLAEAKKDKAAMRAALEAANRFDPSQSDPLKGLIDLAK